MQNRHGYLPGDCHNKFSMMHQCENLRSASDGAVICLTCNFRIVFYLACLRSTIAFPLVEPPTLQFPYLQFFSPVLLASLRQLAAIVFADIAGFTAIMQEDEELALLLRQKFQKKLEELVATHQGCILDLRGGPPRRVFVQHKH